MSAQDFVRQYVEGTAKLTAAYGYNPAEGLDSCGVGLVVALDGKRRRDVVAAGIDALKAVWHRGAVDADGIDLGQTRAVGVDFDRLGRL